MLLKFWLRNVLRATTACTFSTSQLPNVVRSCCVLYSLKSKCASRHNGVHFFHIATSKSGPNMWCFEKNWLGNVLRATTACNFLISHLARWLRARCFSEPTFRPSGAPNHSKNMEKHSFSRLAYLFAHLHLLSSDSFSSLIFSLLLFSSLWLFPSLLFICPYCRKFDF